MCIFHAETLSVNPLLIFAVIVLLLVTVSPNFAASYALIPPDALNPIVCETDISLEKDNDPLSLDL